MSAAELVAIVGGSVAAAGGVGSLAWAAHRWANRLHDVHTAIMGEPSRVVAGVVLPAVPALGERMARIEAEFSPNGGSSLRDTVDRCEQRLDAIETRLGPG